MASAEVRYVLAYFTAAGTELEPEDVDSAAAGGLAAEASLAEGAWLGEQPASCWLLATDAHTGAVLTREQMWERS